MREGRGQSGSGVAVRVRALMALAMVEHGQAGSQQALQQVLDGDDGSGPIRDPRDRGLCTELVYGTLRRQRALDRWLAASCQRGLVGMDGNVLLALRLGAYQLACLRVPPFAAVDATLEALKQTAAAGHTSRAGVGFAHAVLRRLAVRSGSGDAPDVTDLPPWIAAHSAQLAAALGLDPLALERAWSEPAPLHAHALGDGVLDRLEADGVVATRLAVPATATATAGLLQHPALGREVLLQDVASAAVTAVAAAAPRSRVLDIAAGRGVKSAALAHAGAEVTALDVSAAKLTAAAALCDATGWPLAATVTADATAPLPLPAASFDTVLVDAPCSALGTLRRRPEVRHRRRAADVFALARLQRAIAAQSAPMVRRGGVLVLATCSISDEEGPLWLDDFLDGHRDFEIEPCDQPWAGGWRDPRGCLRTHPLWLGADGFFIARLRRA